MNKNILMNEYRLTEGWGKSIRLTNKWMTNKPGLRMRWDDYNINEKMNEWPKNLNLRMRNIRLKNEWMTNKPVSKDGISIRLTNEWMKDQ